MNRHHVQLIGGPADGMELMLDEDIFRSGSVTVPVVDTYPVMDDGSTWPTADLNSTATYRVTLLQGRWIFVGLRPKIY